MRGRLPHERARRKAHRDRPSAASSDRTLEDNLREIAEVKRRYPKHAVIVSLNEHGSIPHPFYCFLVSAFLFLVYSGLIRIGASDKDN